MKITIRQLLILLALAPWVCGQIPPTIHPSPANFSVVNVIPNDLSGEHFQNSEPSLGVGTGSKNNKFILHTFGTEPPSYDFVDHPMNLYFTSVGGGTLWKTNGTFNDLDSTLDWSAGGAAYAAMDGPLGEINVLKSSDPTITANNFSKIVAAKVDNFDGQPWVRVVTVTNVDHIYVGFDNERDADRCIASVRFSLDGGVTWSTTALEKANPGAENSTPVRLAISGDGRTVYGLFQRLASRTEGDYQGGVVLVRDDSFGTGGFNALPNNGTLVANNIVLPASTPLGLVQRIGTGYDVAINPSHPNDVYVAYTEREAFSRTPVLQVQHSSDSGATFNLVYSTTNASLPALAITQDGTVGLLFAKKRGSNLEVHFLKAYGGNFVTQQGPIYDPERRPMSSDRVLASFPDNNPLMTYDPYLGDYFALRAMNYSFYGAFSASGDPDPTHFPCGVYYQRNVLVNGIKKNNFYLSSRGTLVDATTNEAPVPASIDPFFFYDFAPATLVLPGPHLDPPQHCIVPPGDPRTSLYCFVWPLFPPPYPQFQLESSPVLGPSADWTPVTDGVIVETNGAFELTLDLAEDQRYFRLRRDVASGQFQIFTSVGRGGTLSPTGTNDGILLKAGTENQLFTATPDASYAVGNWYLDGAVVQSSNSTMTISNISADHTLLVTFLASHDLAVTMGALTMYPEQPFLVGSNFNYVVNVENVGLNPVSDVAMTDLLPAVVSFVSATTSQGNISNNAGVVVADLGTLSPGALAAVTITVIPNSEGTMTNTVSVACAEFEPDLANNTAAQITAVLTPVTITDQPASEIVLAGDTVSFSVGVSGTPPFLYQWFLNGVGIIGATSDTLTVENVSPSDAGSYTVTVFQKPGPELEYEVDSDPATLTVLP